MSLKWALTWGAIGFVVFYLATNPHGAAAAVDGTLNWFKSAGNSIANFLNNIKL